ncbi:hypothetical protein GPDM_00895 [Planococcus donghaensis MPA1U2]|uniref:Uncharacterized protein n=1 Tax=Planococcus donghaensis MPA1U2 TaxID=933115 RepID=E7RCL5_9BACL|nr:hypothetical protein [Planococcus donghaensis]EGA91380.1 hypothetical protein GPDM_00895 [Planococcus donghaensis MPA1U2]
MTIAVSTEKSPIYLKSYLLFIGLGLIAGVITRLSDFFPNDDLWSFSSIATLFGFWMLTVTLVIYFSTSNINAAINVFLYLLSMNFAFYFLKYVLGFFFPIFANGGTFQWNLFMLYNIIALVCSAISYVLYYWNKESKLSNFLYALPVSGLAAETIGVGMYLYHHHIFLFQFIFDFFSFLLLGFWFYQKTKNKIIYSLTLVAITPIGYYFYYYPFL